MPSCSLKPEAMPSPCPCPPQSGPMRPHVLICLCMYICAAELALSIHPTHASHFQTPQTRPAHSSKMPTPFPKRQRHASSSRAQLLPILLLALLLLVNVDPAHAQDATLLMSQLAGETEAVGQAAVMMAQEGSETTSVQEVSPIPSLS